MMNTIKLVLGTILLCILSVTASPSYAQNSGTYKLIVLKDGSKLKGKIIGKKDNTTITVLLGTGATIDIDYDDIRSMIDKSPITKNSWKEKKLSDRIYFKNGSRIYGDIITSIPHEYLVLKLSNGEEVKFYNEEISKIKYDIRERPGYVQKQDGYFADFDIGLNFGEDNEFSTTNGQLSFQTTIGYRFNPYLKLGIGTGYEKLSGFQAVPIFASISGEIGQRRVTPIYFATVGYGNMTSRSNFNTTVNYDNVQGGLYYQLGTGLNFKWNHYSINWKMGYKAQMGSYEFTQLDWDGRKSGFFEVDRKFKRFTMTVGISI